MNKDDGGRESSRLWDALEQLQLEGFAQVGTLGRKRTRRNADRNEKTLFETSRELKVPPKPLSKFIRKLGLLPDAKWNGNALSIDQATFQALKEIIYDLITLPQTCEINYMIGSGVCDVKQIVVNPFRLDVRFSSPFRPLAKFIPESSEVQRNFRNLFSADDSASM